MDVAVCVMFDNADDHLRLKNAVWFSGEIMILCQNRSWHITQRWWMWCAEKWTRLSKMKLVNECGERTKNVCTVSILRPSRCTCSSFHMFICAFLCVPSNTKQASETTANQTAITSAWWLLCCVQVTLSSTAPVWGPTDAPVQSSTDKPGWKGTWLRGDGAEGRAVSTKPEPSICLILSLTNHILPFCRSLRLAQSLDW